MRIVQGALVAVLALGLGGAQAQEKKPGEKLKVGFVYVGPVADYGYSYQHDQSRKALAAAGIVRAVMAVIAARRGRSSPGS